MTEKKLFSAEQSSPAKPYPFLSGDTAALEGLISVLRTTKLGSELLNDAAEAGVTITTAKLNGAHGSYREDGKIVTMDLSGSADRQIVTLAH